MTSKSTRATLHCAFLGLWMSLTVRAEVAYDGIVKMCTDCTTAVVAIAKGWNRAAPYCDTSESLANRQCL
ncbi:hypothetical protein VD0002_g280 [Verticillium dahliae]|uniref:Uncharacterized protein n=1 Tax=Verticillium dahliae TaxID=27337 RepID=A0AA44WEF0_VERDA|nr:hypothetical protein BJF96_g8746 [Verticillium dahliae]PNH41956.1 hypothetical protein VD0004_g5219 [Verticillium dahliae]PNH51986.1 hypothetical protein VD0003_g5284 [Verticillium dahliae]PNH70453.1 hypothetical protein VD0002_g280 [Verticillium dahliae]PNH71316.1 hypothetical protein VD0001_g6208 [Verticillium dahliae]